MYSKNLKTILMFEFLEGTILSWQSRNLKNSGSQSEIKIRKCGDLSIPAQGYLLFIPVLGMNGFILSGFYFSLI